MRIPSIKYLFILFLFTSLGACVHLKEGEVDYAKTTSSSNNGRLALKPKYASTTAINKGDTISIHLAGAYSHQAPEKRSLEEALNWNGWKKWPGTGANAEIAVIASVCEQGVEGCGTAFGSDSLSNGRVVYFSDSVKARQMMNFSYLPIYGPIKYQGNPLIITLAMVELDIPNEQQKNLVKKLAEIGGKAYPPASGVLKAMDQLGSNMLQGSHHDIAFRYDLTLMPAGGDESTLHPKLSVGNYVFVRKDRVKGEQEKIIWDNLELHAETGRLISSKAQSSDTTSSDAKSSKTDNDFVKDVRKNTYLVMQIQKGFQEASLDNQQTLAILSERLAKKDDQLLQGIDATLAIASKQIARQNQLDIIAKQLAILKTNINENRSLTDPEIQETIDRQKIAAHKTWDLISSAGTKYETNNCDNPTTETDEDTCSRIITEDQFTQIKIELRSIIVSKNPNVVDLDKICPLDGFKIKYSGKGPLANQKQSFIDAVTS